MTDLAIADTAEQALRGTPLRARTAADAAARAGGPVGLAMEALPDTFTDADAAHLAAPDVFALGGEVVLLDGAYRIVMRFWRPLPPLPVAQRAKTALTAPLGHARTEDEAVAIAGTAVTALSEALPARYASIQAARRKWGAMIDAGLAEVIIKGARFAVALRFWRPTPPEVAAEDLAMRLSAPLQARIAQAPLDVGLFETRSPENPDVVLVAEEGDGRRHQE